jgi:hypothetical protein
MKRALIVVIVVGVVLFGLLQLIPVNRANPPVVREVRWDSPETRALAARACFDCHSNETKFPWYASMAPPSILLSNHITEGRDNINFSDWDNYYLDYDEIEEQIVEGKMPPASYLLMHPEAQLSDAEKQQLLDGFEATIEADPGQ